MYSTMKVTKLEAKTPSFTCLSTRTLEITRFCTTLNLILSSKLWSNHQLMLKESLTMSTCNKIKLMMTSVLMPQALLVTEVAFILCALRKISFCISVISSLRQQKTSREEAKKEDCVLCSSATLTLKSGSSRLPDLRHKAVKILNYKGKVHNMDLTNSFLTKNLRTLRVRKKT